MALLAAGAYYTGGALGGTGGFNKGLATLGSVLKKKAAGMVPEFLSGKSGIAFRNNCIRWIIWWSYGR